MNCNYIFYPDMRWISRFSSASRLKNSLIFGAVSQAWLKLWYQKPPYLSLRTLISFTELYLVRFECLYAQNICRLSKRTGFTM